jgi:GTP-binding protein
MSGEFIHTIGDSSGLAPSIKDGYLRGRYEPRLALVGRSNVGKSSLINRIMGQRLAQVSKEPGKTRAIHFYCWKEAKVIFADLPGYGFAKAGGDEKDRWAKFIQGYFKADDRLLALLQLLDARHGPTDSDLESLQFFRSLHKPVIPVFTKFDQLKNQSERAKRLREAGAALASAGLDPETALWVSSEKGDGMKALEAMLKGLVK